MALRVVRNRSTSNSSGGHWINGPSAPSFVARYTCPKGHTFDVRFAEGVEAPGEWECKRDAATGRLVDGELTLPTASGRPVRTPWDMLRERRSIDDLELLLQERLDVIRARRGK